MNIAQLLTVSPSVHITCMERTPVLSLLGALGGAPPNVPLIPNTDLRQWFARWHPGMEGEAKPVLLDEAA